MYTTRSHNDVDDDDIHFGVNTTLSPRFPVSDGFLVRELGSVSHSGATYVTIMLMMVQFLLLLLLLNVFFRLTGTLGRTHKTRVY